MYDNDRCFRPSTRLFRSSMTLLSVVLLTALLVGAVLAQAPTRDTRSWSDPGGSGLTITFSTPQTYESCTSVSDRIFTTGIPNTWSLLGSVEVYWATTTGAERINSIPVRQNGNLDLTIPYPPAATWPDLNSIGNPLRELHIAVGILVKDQSGNVVPWVGGDPANAPGILGAGGQVWDIICLPTGPTPTPTNTPPGQLGSLGDRVWRDDNGNGIQDNGEPGIPSASVVLLDCNGNVLTSGSTNATGNYLFSNLNAGCYVVQFDPVSGLSYSPANQGADDTKDSDANPAGGGRTGPINLGAGENNPTVDAGFVPPAPTGSIGDRVWRDDNSNGIQDPGEPGIPGVTVQLKDCNNNVLRTTTTDGNGNYSFTGLAAGCYRVGVVPTGFTISPANQGADDTRDSDVDPATAMTGNINLGQGENNPTVDAGLIPQQPNLGSLGDRLWRDDNSNGIQDAGEPGVSGITVQLKDCNNNVLRTTTTDSNGIYGFTGLNAGCYVVRFVNINSNLFAFTTPDQGGDDTRDSDVTQLDSVTPGIVNGQTEPITLAQGQNNPTIDAGLIPQQPNLGSLGDRVWRDDNSNGIQDPGEPGVPGVTVQLKDCNNNVLRTTTTDNNGIYSFTGLAAGCYRIGILPNGYTISPANQGTDDTRDSDVDPTTAMTGNINLGQGENNPTIDAGVFTPQPVGSIGDRVFEDLNSNGIQDNGEPGVPNVTVQLKDCNNNVLRTTTTDGSGTYLFNNLTAGCYTVGVVLPAGREFTAANQGTDDTRDSDINPVTGMTGPINLDPGENDLTNDAGLRAPLACGLTVEQKCQVPAPPPTSNFVCSDAKPLNDLSMVWNGTQRVDVKAWKGAIGSTLLATVTNVAPGQVVNVTGYAGAPNDVIWEVFATGTTNKLGESTFHLSCSDPNMDGPEDCGAIQGDGKDKTGFLNLWKLEGMGGNGIRFTCSSTPPTPTDSCTVISGGGSVCNGTKPKSLTFRYTGGSCANSTNPQDGKFTCSGSPGTGAVTIAVTGKDASKFSVTPSSVTAGQEVTISRTDGSTFPADTKLQVGSQALSIHTSCSQQLNLGDVFGSLVLVGADGKRLDTPVTFTYLVANSGDALSNVTLEDDFGPVAAPFSLARGASQNFQRQTTIGETTINTAFVRGVLASGQQCEDSDETTVVIEAPALSCQDGKPVALTFEYTGGSCSDTTNTQSGKLLCSGAPGTDPVSIVITKDADKIAVRPSSVSRGQRFTMSRTDGREFAADTLLRVGGQSLSIHTSCSQQLNVGDVFGSLRLVVFTPKGFPIPASAQNSGNQTFLPLIQQQ